MTRNISAPIFSDARPQSNCTAVTDKVAEFEA